MRMMVRWKVPVDRGNAAIRDGSLTRVLEDMIDKLKPEAAYFWPNDGERGGMMVFDMTDTSQIPIVAEPLFLDLDAAVEFLPVMNPDDLRRALAQIGG